MTTPFESIAPQYAALWSDTPRGRSQREQVWRVTDGLFHKGDRVLDLGCGTGDDAVHLMALGADVLGTDAAAGMIEIARRRGIHARHMAIEDLASLTGAFDGVLSNFGALNCVANLAETSAELARLVRPAGIVALCVISRFYWRGDWKHLARRWSGHTVWRGMDVYYRTARSIARSFAPAFEFQRCVSIGRGDHQLLVLRRRTAC